MDTALVVTLPVLTAENEAEYPDWHAYARLIYAGSPPYPIDLNTFSWFYWNSPLRLSHLLLSDWNQGARDTGDSAFYS